MLCYTQDDNTTEGIEIESFLLLAVVKGKGSLSIWLWTLIEIVCRPIVLKTEFLILIRVNPPRRGNTFQRQGFCKNRMPEENENIY